MSRQGQARCHTCSAGSGELPQLWGETREQEPGDAGLLSPPCSGARFLLAFILQIWLKNMLRLASRGGLEQVEQRCSFEQPKLVVLCKGKVGLKKNQTREKMKMCPYEKSHFFKAICSGSPLARLRAALGL